MITVARARHVEALLAEGKRPYFIRRTTGVHSTTIARIKAGTWNGWHRASGHAVRCPGCGGLIDGQAADEPCVLCTAVTHLESTPPGPPAPETVVTPADLRKFANLAPLRLRPDHRERYDAIHAAKVAEGANHHQPLTTNHE